MSAKPLNCVDRSYRSKPEGVATAADGRMAKHYFIAATFLTQVFIGCTDISEDLMFG